MSANRVPASGSNCSSGPAPAASDNGPNAAPVAVVNGWVMVDGCKVARVGPDGTLAFHDRDRRRSSVRGSDQPRCTVADLARAVAQAASLPPEHLRER